MWKAMLVLRKSDITVNGYNARNDDELAQTVADKINGMIHEDDSVFK